MVKAKRGSAGFDSAREALRTFAATASRPRVNVDVDPTSLL
jgi:hypothetical protein